MQRLGAVFIAICMVAISASIGAIFYLSVGLSIPEAAPISFGVLLTLLLIHYQITRVRDRLMLDEQMDDITRLKLGLTKELQDVREMTQRLEDDLSNRMEKEVEPILAELDLIGALVKQLAESCAEIDERVQAGDNQVRDVHDKLRAATQSVKELETLLRASMRNQPERFKFAEEQRSAQALPSPPPARSDDYGSGAYEQERYGDRHPDPRHDMRGEPDAYHPGRDYEAPRGESRSDFERPAPQQPEREEEPSFTRQDEADVRRALALGQIELFMQPIVSLPMRKPMYYESFSRLKRDDGSLITPDVFLPVCRKNGFMPMLDRLAVNEGFRLLRRLVDRGRGVDCFFNLSLESLADSDFFALMRDLFDKNKDLAEHVVLEFSQKDLDSFGMLEDETLQLLRSMGFRFSVDKIGDLTGDFDALSRKGIRFAKVAASILTHKESGRGLDIHPADLSRLLSRKGVELVATHVADETALVSLIDFSVHLAQGNHFAPAKPLKAGADDMRMTSDSQQRAPMAGGQSPQAVVPSRQGQPPRGSQAGMRPQAAPSPYSSQPARQDPGTMGQRSAGGFGSGAAGSSGDYGAGRSGGSGEPEASSRPLGQNPRVAEALRVMANQDPSDSSTREHFRAVLAEAAGLIGPDGGAPQRRGPQSAPVVSTNGARSEQHLPASGEFGLNTAPERGQFLDLSEGDGTRQRAAGAEQPRSTGPGGFERLIR